MKHLLLTLTVFSTLNAFSQGGTWTWISGDSTTTGLPVYGTQGVPSINNHPRGFYEASDWKDKQGNFWIYGGLTTMADNYDDLWKFDPLTREWTWVKGSGVPASSYPRVYGTIGIPDPLNTPGSREWGAATWVDTSGNLWLFGGSMYAYNDLWRYNIATNEWTCVRGSAAGNYGTKGVPSIFNVPWGRQETASNWTDSLNNLWLFGGNGYCDTSQLSSLNNLWKYDIGNDEWTWMKGSDSLDPVGSSGIRGISDPLNEPSGRWTYSKWKSIDGNFWFMGGGPSYGMLNDLWKYDLSLNEWTWMDGTIMQASGGAYLQYCANDTLNIPSGRTEHRSCVTDNCGRFWLFGGASYIGTRNDLWMYDPSTLTWKWFSGSSLTNQSGNFGTINVPSPLNMPPSRTGGNAWWGNDDRFYLFGGSYQGGVGNMSNSSSSMWMFTPDSICLGACNNLIAGFQSLNSNLCPGTCTDFLNLSFGAANYQWSFPGAVPDTSTSLNPSNICYANPGNYDVQLIASSASGSDTILLTNYIHVYPAPLPQSITQGGDTLFALSGATSYQWYFNGNLINGATDNFYVALQSGNYNVVCTDINDCEVEAVIFDVIAAISQFADGSGQLAIFPNPVEDKFTIQKLAQSVSEGSKVKSGTAIEISIYNVPGEKVMTVELKPDQSTIDCHMLPPGMYSIEIISGENIYRAKFVKQ